jgi:hypothetical protein
MTKPWWFKKMTLTRVFEVFDDLLDLLLDLINAVDVIPANELRTTGVNEHLTAAAAPSRGTATASAR